MRLFHPTVDADSLANMTWPEATIVLVVSVIVVFVIRWLAPSSFDL
jgi:hypothetical protein